MINKRYPANLQSATSASLLSSRGLSLSFSTSHTTDAQLSRAFGPEGSMREKDPRPMDESRIVIGFLNPLSEKKGDNLVAKVPLYEGSNIVGRDILSVSDKRVSRKHVSLNASAGASMEITVEGPNPVVLKSSHQVKKLRSQEKATISPGDILELIPGHYFLRYDAKYPELKSATSGSKSHEVQGHSGANATFVNRKRKILQEETLLKENEANHTFINGVTKTLNQELGESIVREAKPDPVIFKGDDSMAQFYVSEDKMASTFRLLRVKGLPKWANTSTVALHDIIKGEVHVAILSNYMVDIDWLISACPLLRIIPNVLIIHGDSDATLHHMKRNKGVNWIIHKPPLPIAYGTHHSKAIFLVYPRGLRVVVHTANLIYVDWNNKTQGLWMQDFPWKDIEARSCSSPFEEDLVDYLEKLKWPGLKVTIPHVGNTTINSSFFRKFDFSRAMVRLIASVPGYHSGKNLKRWGHMKLRDVLQSFVFENEFQKSPIAYQFSSLGSLDEKWMDELATSMSSGLSDDRKPLGLGRVQIIWPRVEDVRCSLEGYAAGNALPSPQKNIEKMFLKKFWYKWKADHIGRSRAMPHIKSYTRYNGQKLAWFILTSANLSKAAWGALQKNESQLMIRSYELGVIFLPSWVSESGFQYSCTCDEGSMQKHIVESPKREKTILVTLCWEDDENVASSELIRLPVPYQLPPEPYTLEDLPWSWDKHYHEKDAHGQTWPR